MNDSPIGEPIGQGLQRRHEIGGGPGIGGEVQHEAALGVLPLLVLSVFVHERHGPGRQEVEGQLGSLGIGGVHRVPILTEQEFDDRRRGGPIGVPEGEVEGRSAPFVCGRYGRLSSVGEDDQGILGRSVRARVVKRLRAARTQDKGEEGGRGLVSF